MIFLVESKTTDAVNIDFFMKLLLLGANLEEASSKYVVKVSYTYNHMS